MNIKILKGISSYFLSTLPMIMVLACRQVLKKRHPPIGGCQKNPSLGD